MISRPLSEKSTTETIRQRFDADVERFSNLETGQAAAIDAPLMMELVIEAALASNPKPQRVLDLGCGAGNYTLKLLQDLPEDAAVTCELSDLSAPMLERAAQRVGELPACQEARTHHGDLRELELEPASVDVILAAAVFHHLREEEDWQSVFESVFTWLKPGGSLWISDPVSHQSLAIDTLMWQRYQNYLEGLGGQAYAQEVLDYIDEEDSPRPLTWQLELLAQVGFTQLDILHKNSAFAAFGGVKPVQL